MALKDAREAFLSYDPVKEYMREMADHMEQSFREVDECIAKNEEFMRQWHEGLTQEQQQEVNETILTGSSEWWNLPWWRKASLFAEGWGLERRAAMHGDASRSGDYMWSDNPVTLGGRWWCRLHLRFGKSKG